MTLRWRSTHSRGWSHGAWRYGGGLRSPLVVSVLLNLLCSMPMRAQNATYTPEEREIASALVRLATHIDGDTSHDEALLRRVAEQDLGTALAAFQKAIRDRHMMRLPCGATGVLGVAARYFPPDPVYEAYGDALREVPALLDGFRRMQKERWDLSDWRMCEKLAAGPPDSEVARAARERLQSLARVGECQTTDFEPFTAYGFAALGYGLASGVHRRTGDGQAQPREVRLRRALECLSRAVELDGELPEARLWRAQVLLAMGDAQSALEDANRGVARLPSSSEAYATRAECHRALARNVEADEDEKTRDQLGVGERVAWVRSPEGRSKLLFRASTYIRGSLAARAQGKNQDAKREGETAVEIYDELVRCSPEDPMLRLGRALLSLHLERWEAVTDDATSLLNFVPDAAYAYHLRARAQRALARDSSADEATYGRILAEVRLPVKAELPAHLLTVNRPQCELTVEGVKKLALDPSPRSAVRLAEVLIATDTPKEVWEEASQVLTEFPDEALREALHQLHTYVVQCTRSDVDRADEPVALLGRLADPASAGYLLIGLLRDGEATRAISTRAAMVLAEYPPELAVRPLTNALILATARDNEWVIERALTALNHIDPDIGRRFFTEFLLKGSREQQVRAARSLWDIAGMLALVEVVTDAQTKQRVREQAATALSHFPMGGDDVATWAQSQMGRAAG